MHASSNEIALASEIIYWGGRVGLFQSMRLTSVEHFVQYLAFGAVFSVSDVLSDNSLHLFSQHGILSQLWAEETVGR